VRGTKSYTAAFLGSLVHLKMNKEQAIPTNSLLYYRLIALWALAEALLGGIIHGLRIPVSGLVVGSCAVICICLIAWYAPAKG